MPVDSCISVCNDNVGLAWKCARARFGGGEGGSGYDIRPGTSLQNHRDADVRCFVPCVAEWQELEMHLSSLTGLPDSDRRALFQKLLEILRDRASLSCLEDAVSDG